MTETERTRNTHNHTRPNIRISFTVINCTSFPFHSTISTKLLFVCVVQRMNYRHSINILPFALWDLFSVAFLLFALLFFHLCVSFRFVFVYARVFNNSRYLCVTVRYAPKSFGQLFPSSFFVHSNWRFNCITSSVDPMYFRVIRLNLIAESFFLSKRRS